MIVHAITLLLFINFKSTSFRGLHVDALAPVPQIAPHYLRRDVQGHVFEPVLLSPVSFHELLVLARYLGQADGLFAGFLYQRHINIFSLRELQEVLFLCYSNTYAQKWSYLLQQQKYNSLGLLSLPFLYILRLQLSNVDINNRRLPFFGYLRKHTKCFLVEHQDLQILGEDHSQRLVLGFVE